MSHEHHHHHVQNSTEINRAFIIGIVLNSVFVLIEAVAGFATNSLGLLTDAGHNLSDVASLLLALLAIRLTKVKSNKKFTYGYRKTTILAALFNAVLLLIAIGSIGWEAIQRLSHPEIVQSKTVAYVAGIGIVINAVTAYFFFHNKEKDLNVKGAYLHLAADALVSMGVVVAAIVMLYTNWYWLDSVISFVIIIVIFFSTWGLLKETIRLSVDGVPANIDIDEIRERVVKMQGVTDVHHIHAWGLSTNTNALTAHIVLDENMTLEKMDVLKGKIKHELEHLNIHHATLEFEQVNHCADDENQI
jgi:cobalt-zinc-cadmium efflux system protein